MAPPRRRKSGPSRRKSSPPAKTSQGGGSIRDGKPVSEAARLRLKALDDRRLTFLPPLCALDRREDLDEVQTMIAAGELEIARDELLYLVADCRAFLEAHNLLGELALEEGDVALAKGHYGFAYEIGLDSLPPGFHGLLPANKGYNGVFFQAGRGLARCLIARGEAPAGREVLRRLLQFDPQERQTRELLEELDRREKK